MTPGTGAIENRLHASSAAMTVVIVNGNSEMLSMLQRAMGTGHFDVVFVQSSSHAYSQIKRVRPNVVILCVRIDDAASIQVLSMLRLDEETRGIPVITYASEDRRAAADEDEAKPSSFELFRAARAAVRMN